MTTTLEHLARMDPLIRTMARERVPSALYEDAAQEARIAVWQESERRKDDPKPLNGLLTVVARRAVLDVAQGRPMTGEIGKRGRTRDPLRSRTAVELDPARDDSALPDHAEEIDQRVAVAQLLAVLTPRARWFVTEVYLHDRPIEAVASEMGTSVECLETAWAMRIRPKLARVLGDVA